MRSTRRTPKWRNGVLEKIAQRMAAMPAPSTLDSYAAVAAAVPHADSA